MSLKIERLNVELQEDEILHEVSLEIKDGEFVSLLGQSGCGKSTLLKSIAGLMPVKSGEISIDNHSIKEVAPEKRGTVIVFQDLRLFPHMTVEKNIAFAMELKKVPKEIQKQTVKSLLEDVQLAGYEHRKVREMSGGQLQRVALARALAANPKVLLLDEPFSGLDEKLRLEMGALVKKLHEERNLTTILVTHDKREALQMSDRIALMSDGNLLQYDTPQNIFYHPVSKAVAEYFGKANYIEGEVRDHLFQCELGAFKTECSDGMYTAVIRPFDVKPDFLKEGFEIKEAVFKGETVELRMFSETQELLSEVITREYPLEKLQQGTHLGIEIKAESIVYLKKMIDNVKTAVNV